MAKLTISDLSSTSSHLLFNSEDSIQDLSEEEMNIKGGALPILIGLAILLYPSVAY